MAVVYKHAYAEVSVYGHAVALLKEQGGEGGVHVDIGCGYGAIAEPIRDELGRFYIGFDLAKDGLESLRERGFAVHQIDLSRPELAEVVIRDAVGDRPVKSFSILDTLEHLVNGPDVLAMLRRLAGESDAVLVVSVPNVTHKDIALKALVGRWDVTEAGLLDHTHVDFYSAGRLYQRAIASGWREVGRKDWLLETSDQSFPARLPLFDVSSPLGGYLRGFVGGANPTALVNQFVRAFRPMEPVEISPFADRDEDLAEGLTVVTVLRGHASTMPISALKGLALQTERTLEVILIDAREQNDIDKNELTRVLAKLSDMNVRMVKADVANDGEAFRLGLDLATRRFATFLPQHEKPAKRWALEILAGVAANPGRVVWSRPGADPGPRLSPFLDPDQPMGAFAVPVMAGRMLGSSIENCMPEGAVQVLISLTANLCGLALAQVSAPIIDNAPQTGSADPVPNAVLSFLARRPMLLPPSWAVAVERNHQEARAAADVIRSVPEAEGSLWNLRMLAANAPHYHAELISLRAREAELLTANRLLEISPQLREFVAPHLERLRSAGPQPQLAGPRPFLSIITRTQGQRLSTLTETLLTLGGQSSDDFELVLVVHAQDSAVLAEVQALVAEFPERLTSRISVIQCVREGRSAPLNDGIDAAKGDYVVVLDDDDFVFANYVETFKTMAREAPGRLLRAVCVRQDFGYEGQGRWPRSRAQSWFQQVFTADYDAVEHLSANHTPFMSIAFPGALFRELGMRFDETLTTLEDWHLTTIAASLCGVHAVPEITSVYRWWTNAGSSLFAHESSEWVDNRARVIAEGATRPLLLPSGARAAIAAATERLQHLEREVVALYHERQDLHQQRQDLESQRHVLERKGQELAAQRDQARDMVHQLRSSTSWRLTKPLRWLGRETSSPLPWAEDDLDGEILMEMARHYLDSTSWRVTRPVRALTARLKGRPDDSYRPNHPVNSPAEARRILDEVRGSTSWWLSMPLRLAGRILRRGRN